MAKAARAIVVENGRILVMKRIKGGNTYFTLVGGRVHDDESLETGLVREVKEETNLDVVSSQLVYVEEHPEPYNQQYIYLCQVGPHDATIALQDSSEESRLNTISMDSNVHVPLWVDARSLSSLAFRTPQLQDAIILALKKGFPQQPIKL